MGCFDERRQVAVHYNIGAGHEGGEVKASKEPRRQCHLADYFGANFTVGRSVSAASGSYIYEWALTGPGRMASTRVVGAWSIAGERVNSKSTVCWLVGGGFGVASKRLNRTCDT